MPADVSMHGDLKQLLTQRLTPHLDLPALQALKQTTKVFRSVVEAVDSATWVLILRCKPTPRSVFTPCAGSHSVQLADWSASGPICLKGIPSAGLQSVQFRRQTTWPTSTHRCVVESRGLFQSVHCIQIKFSLD